jgi:hypothetical protein
MVVHPVLVFEFEVVKVVLIEEVKGIVDGLVPAFAITVIVAGFVFQAAEVFAESVVFRKKLRNVGVRLIVEFIVGFFGIGFGNIMFEDIIELFLKPVAFFGGTGRDY